MILRHHVQTYPTSKFPRCGFPMVITPSALQQILSKPGTLPPEAGGMLLSPFGKMGIAIYEHDETGSANASGAAYRPDVEFRRERRQFYMPHYLHIGDLHTHPGTSGQLSPEVGEGLGDLGYLRAWFELNEMTDWVLSPIITLGDNEVVFHPWVVNRYQLDRPFQADAFIVGEESEFPTMSYNQIWAASIGEFCNKPEVAESSDQADESPQPVTTEPVEPAEPAILNQSAERQRDFILKTYLSRAGDNYSAAYHQQTILCVGTGAGSYAVKTLARTCPREIRLVDFDIVESHNLSRTTYTIDEIGQPKVEALKDQILAENPYTRITAHAVDLLTLSPESLDELLTDVDLLIAGTDQFAAQARINELSHQFNIPAVFVGIYAQASAGRIIWQLPGQTPCYRCIARERYADETAERDLDGAMGNIADCRLIDTVLVKVCQALLDRDQASRMGQFFEWMNSRNDIIIRTHPHDGWGNQVWDAVLNDLPNTPKDYGRELREQALFAMDSLWLAGQDDPNCPYCHPPKLTQTGWIQRYRQRRKQKQHTEQAA